MYEYLAFSTKNYTIRHDRFSDLVENRLSQLWIIIVILWNENENQPVASRRVAGIKCACRYASSETNCFSFKGEKNKEKEKEKENHRLRIAEIARLEKI